MISKLRSWWQYIRKHWKRVMVIALVIAFALVIYAGYRFNLEWTGLGPEMSEPKQHEKTLWDWLGVFAIPIVVGLGAAWYTAQQGKVSDRENTDNQRETALQAYIDKMSELLLEKDLGGASPKDEVRTIARVRTVTILFQLDARRIGYVFTFLREAGLMSNDSSKSNIVSLSGADLREVNWSQANLYEVNLSGALLSRANLAKTNLIEANLSNALLNEADLSGASLFEADLSGATLSGALLINADLTGAIVTQEQLKQAKSLEGVTIGKSKYR